MTDKTSNVLDLLSEWGESCIAVGIASQVADDGVMNQVRKIAKSSRKKLVEAIEQKGWMPIASAPKDGTEIILYGLWVGEITYLTGAEPSVDVGRWMSGKSDHPGNDWWQLTTGDCYTCWMRATHWMPIQKPPK